MIILENIIRYPEKGDKFFIDNGDPDKLIAQEKISDLKPYQVAEKFLPFTRTLDLLNSISTK
jgi:hypothetical protein